MNNIHRPSNSGGGFDTRCRLRLFTPPSFRVSGPEFYSVETFRDIQDLTGVLKLD